MLALTKDPQYLLKTSENSGRLTAVTLVLRNSNNKGSVSNEVAHKSELLQQSTSRNNLKRKSELAWHHASSYKRSSSIVESTNNSRRQTAETLVLRKSNSKGSLPNEVAHKSELLQQSTSSHNLKRKSEIASHQVQKYAKTETCYEGSDWPQTSHLPSLPNKAVKYSFDGSSVLSMVPAKRTLADYLREPGPSLYGSTELYPADEARSIIQGMVTAILNLRKDKRQHNYIRHPENLILRDKECHPYSRYVRDLASGDVQKTRKMLEQAGLNFSTSIDVTLEQNRMNRRSDDLAALKYLIFDVILVLNDGKKPLLPAEWEAFKELFSNNELDLAVLSSYPCLWGYPKRIRFYTALDNWCRPSKSEKGVRYLVINSLISMRIFMTNWVKRLDKDSHLLKFVSKMTSSRMCEVYVLIRFFRNLVEHSPDRASASSPYKKERYLDYKLRKMYPNLLEELYQRMLFAGFRYYITGFA